MGLRVGFVYLEAPLDLKRVNFRLNEGTHFSTEGWVIVEKSLLADGVFKFVMSGDDCCVSAAVIS